MADQLQVNNIYATEINASLQNGTSPLQKNYTPEQLQNLTPHSPFYDKPLNLTPQAQLYLMTIADNLYNGDSRWVTYDEAKNIGLVPNRGSKGVKIQIPNPSKPFPVTLFNINQCVKNNYVIPQAEELGKQLLNKPAPLPSDSIAKINDQTAIDRLINNSSFEIRNNYESTFENGHIYLKDKENYESTEEYYTDVFRLLARANNNGAYVTQNDKPSIELAQYQELNDHIASFFNCVRHGVGFSGKDKLSLTSDDYLNLESQDRFFALGTINDAVITANEVMTDIEQNMIDHPNRILLNVPETIADLSKIVSLPHTQQDPKSNRYYIEDDSPDVLEQYYDYLNPTFKQMYDSYKNEQKLDNSNNIDKNNQETLEKSHTLNDNSNSINKNAKEQTNEPTITETTIHRRNAISGQSDTERGARDSRSVYQQTTSDNDSRRGSYNREIPTSNSGSDNQLSQEDSRSIQDTDRTIHATAQLQSNDLGGNSLSSQQSTNDSAISNNSGSRSIPNESESDRQTNLNSGSSDRDDGRNTIQSRGIRSESNITNNRHEQELHGGRTTTSQSIQGGSQGSIHNRSDEQNISSQNNQGNRNRTETESDTRSVDSNTSNNSTTDDSSIRNSENINGSFGRTNNGSDNSTTMEMHTDRRTQNSDPRLSTDGTRGFSTGASSESDTVSTESRSMGGSTSNGSNEEHELQARTGRVSGLGGEVHNTTSIGRGGLRGNGERGGNGGITSTEQTQTQDSFTDQKKQNDIRQPQVDEYQSQIHSLEDLHKALPSLEVLDKKGELNSASVFWDIYTGIEEFDELIEEKHDLPSSGFVDKYAQLSNDVFRFYKKLNDRNLLPENDPFTIQFKKQLQHHWGDYIRRDSIYESVEIEDLIREHFSKHEYQPLIINERKKLHNLLLQQQKQLQDNPNSIDPNTVIKSPDLEQYQEELKVEEKKLASQPRQLDLFEQLNELEQEEEHEQEQANTVNTTAPNQEPDTTTQQEAPNTIEVTQAQQQEAPKQEEAPQTQTIEANTITDEDLANAKNYQIKDNDFQVGTPLERYNNNINAIKTLYKIEEENRLATPEEQEVLAKYVGWGGLADAFDEQKSPNQYNELKSLLNEDDYRSAFMSTTTSFYTSPAITKSIYKALDNLGFKGGKILEPSMGVGNFFGAMPEELANNSTLHGVEIDPLSGRIAQKLYPHAKVTISGFEKTNVSNYYDVAIGNVPFGQTKPYDKKFKNENFSIHNYFFAKALDEVKPGGVVAFVTSSYTMDSMSDKARKYIGENADFLGAIRLPNNAFKASAGTDVTSDIIFLQKREITRTVPLSPKNEKLSSMGRDIYQNIVNHYDETINPEEDKQRFLKLNEDYFLNLYRNERYSFISRDNSSDIRSYEENQKFELLLNRNSDVVKQLDKIYKSIDCVNSSFKRTKKDENGNVIKEQVAKNGEYERNENGKYRFKAVEEDVHQHTFFINETQGIKQEDLERFFKFEKFIIEDSQTVSYEEFEKQCNLFTGKIQEQTLLEKKDLFTSDFDFVYSHTLDNGAKLNEYFYNNPDMILGDVSVTTDRFGKTVLDVAPKQDVSLEQQLDKAIENIRGNFDTFKHINDQQVLDEQQIHTLPVTDLSIPNNAFRIIGEDTYQRQNDLMVQIDVGFSKNKKEKTRDFVKVMNSLENLINYQLENDNDDHLAEYQADLKANYDAFTKKYKQLLNQAFIQKSPFTGYSGYAKTLALENITKRGRTISLKSLSPMFDTRIVNPIKNVKATNSNDALIASMTERGNVDFDYMADLLKLPHNEDTYEKFSDDLKGQIFRDPQQLDLNDYSKGWIPADEYLSGNIIDKIDEAKNLIESNPELEMELKHNIEELEKVKPEQLEANDIAINIGSRWIPTRFYLEFAKETFNMKVPFNSQGIIYNKATDSYQIDPSSKYRESDSDQYEKNIIFGTPKRNMLSIFEDKLNLSTVIINKEKQPGEEKPQKDPEATHQVQSCMNRMNQEFKSWVWSDPQRTKELVELYNRKFNNNRLRQFDGSHINLNGANSNVELRSHQKEAIARALYGKNNTLLAHVVGAGKTFEMIGIAMEKKRLGLCNKTMIAVPNSLRKQWENEFYKLYPQANIIVARDSDLSKQNRNTFLSKVASSDADVVIVSHSQLTAIPISKERLTNYFSEDLNKLKDALTEAKLDAQSEQNRSQRSSRNLTVKTISEAMNKLSQNFAKKLDQLDQDPDAISFEQLGVDQLMVDEAHMFKNLGFTTKLKNISGLPTTNSQRATDLFYKCRFMNEKSDNNIVFATGTPISNSLGEMYTMQRYLNKKDLEDKGLNTFDSWASVFTEPMVVNELNGNGGFTLKTKLQFNNVPELANMFRNVADIKLAQDLNLPRPEAKVFNIVADPSFEQQQVMQEFLDRASKIHKGKVRPYQDNMLKLTTDGRKLATDQRLYDPSLPDDPNSKVNIAVKNVYDIWVAGEETKDTQLMFLDLGTPSKEENAEIDGIDVGDSENKELLKNAVKFNLYADIKEKLIKKGIPEEQIAFIHDAESDAQRDELFAKVNAGEVRVLLGSTGKMGAGMNVQQRLKAVHHIDCCWRPADMEQREGRAIRQGNQNKEVEIYRYLTKGTFDPYMYQSLQYKAKVKDQIITSKNPNRSVKDVSDQALSYAEVVAITSGDRRPLLVENLTNEIKELEAQKVLHETKQVNMRTKIRETLPNEISKLKRELGSLKEKLNLSNNSIKKNDKGEIIFSGFTLEGKTYDNPKDAHKQLTEFAKNFNYRDRDGHKIPNTEYRGFQMSLQKCANGSVLVQFYSSDHDQNYYNVPLGLDSRIFKKIDKNIEPDSLKKEIEEKENSIKKAEQSIDNLKNLLNKPFEQELELIQKKEECFLVEMDMLLSSCGTKTEYIEYINEITKKYNIKNVTEIISNDSDKKYEFESLYNKASDEGKELLKNAGFSLEYFDLTQKKAQENNEQSLFVVDSDNQQIEDGQFTEETQEQEQSQSNDEVKLEQTNEPNVQELPPLPPEIQKGLDEIKEIIDQKNQEQSELQEQTKQPEQIKPQEKDQARSQENDFMQSHLFISGIGSTQKPQSIEQEAHAKIEEPKVVNDSNQVNNDHDDLSLLVTGNEPNVNNATQPDEPKKEETQEEIFQKMQDLMKSNPEVFQMFVKTFNETNQKLKEQANTPKQGNERDDLNRGSQGIKL